MAERRSARSRMAPLFAVYRWILLVIVTIALVALIPTAITEFADSSSTGVPGTATVTHCDKQAYQTCYGDFTSTDGRVVITSAEIAGGGEDSVGTKLDAYGDTATRTINVPLSGPIIVRNIALPIVLVLIWIPLVWLCVWRPIKRRVLRRRQGTGKATA
jgi:hypothetical protein